MVALLLASAVAAESMECSECGLNDKGECVHRHDHAMEKAKEHVSCFLCGAVNQCSGSVQSDSDDGDGAKVAAAATAEKDWDKEEEEGAKRAAEAEAVKTKAATAASIMAEFLNSRDRRRRLLVAPPVETREVAPSSPDPTPLGSSLSLDLNVFQPCSSCGVNGAGQCVHLSDLDRRHSRGTISCFLCGYSGACPHDVTFHCPAGQEDLCATTTASG